MSGVTFKLRLSKFSFMFKLMVHLIVDLIDVKSLKRQDMNGCKIFKVTQQFVIVIVVRGVKATR